MRRSHGIGNEVFGLCGGDLWEDSEDPRLCVIFGCCEEDAIRNWFLGRDKDEKRGGNEDGDFFQAIVNLVGFFVVNRYFLFCFILFY